MARDKHFKVWLDGKIVDPEHATLSVFTLTVLRGANVYTPKKRRVLRGELHVGTNPARFVDRKTIE